MKKTKEILEELDSIYYAGGTKLIQQNYVSISDYVLGGHHYPKVDLFYVGDQLFPVYIQYHRPSGYFREIYDINQNQSPSDWQRIEE